MTDERTDDRLTVLAAIEHLANGRTDETAQLLGNPHRPGVTAAAVQLATDWALLHVDGDLGELHRRLDVVRMYVITGEAAEPIE